MLLIDALHALNPSQPPSPTTARLAGVLCITVALLLHGTMLKTGLHIQNALGLFKLFVLVGIALSGLASLLQVKGFRLENVNTPSFHGGKELKRVRYSPHETSNGTRCGRAHSWAA